MTLSEFFKNIWNSREHFSEISGEPLFEPGHYQWHWQFSHILPHGLYKKFKFRKDNIILLTPREHEMWTRRPDKLRDIPKWKEVFEKYEQLKQEYHNDK